MANKQLTMKQQLFTNEYLIHGSGVKAARAAGYGDKMPEGIKKDNYLRRIGSENVTKCNIKAVIDAKRAKITEKLEITIETQIRKSQEVIEAATRKGDFNAVNTAIMAQSKHLGLIKDKIQHEDISEHKTLSEQELQELRRVALRLNNIKSRTG